MDAAHSEWVDSMPEAYERWLGPTIFEPFAEDLARRVAALAPRRILELAAGTGIATRQLLAQLTDAEVVATDLNPAMVELGRRLAPGATWERADATALPIDDTSFDVVTCQFGVMFFPDRVAALAEARRVLRPGGTVIVSTWDTVERHAFAAALTAALEQTFPDDPPTFVVAVPHGYTDEAVIEGDLRAAGFADVAVERIRLEGRADAAADIARGFCTGTPLHAELERRGSVESAGAAIAAEMTALLGAGPMWGEMAALVATAVAPA
jgi:SAM-dependent methyltransferase